MNKTDNYLDKHRIYGSSSFGYTLHFQEKIDLVGMEFLSNFNEILLIEDSLQLMENKEKIDEYILMLNKSKSLKNIEVNICTLFLNYKYWNQGFYKNVNYVNYCEHGVSKLKW